MQRILVMGSSGSGKSTFSKQLSTITGLPIVSLDAMFWQPGWIEGDRAEFRVRLIDAVRQPRWIMDGNYTSHLIDERRDVSDTIIWFDLPRWTCVLGVLTRIARGYGRVRSEMAEGCPEKIDFEFFRYVWTFRKKQRPKLLTWFEGLRPDQSFVTFVNRDQADRYLIDLAAASRAASAR